VGVRWRHALRQPRGRDPEADVPVQPLDPQKTLWKELVPADRAGLIRIENVWVTPDGAHYAYSFNRVTNSDLYVVTGWK
jgi:hypothetical protein